MKSIEIENENVERHLSTNEKRNEKTLNTESKGTITIGEEYGTLKYERRLAHPREIVWKAITDPKEVCPITKEPSTGTRVVQLILSIL